KDREGGFVGGGFVEGVGDRYFEVNERFDDRLDEVEEIVFSTTRGDDIPREVFDLRRSMVQFRRAVAPLREVLAAMLRREAECLGEAAIVHLQDVYDHVLRVPGW